LNLLTNNSALLSPHQRTKIHQSFSFGGSFPSLRSDQNAKLQYLYVIPLLLALCLLSIPCSGRAADLQNVNQVTALTLEGLHHAYNFELDSAEAKFNEAVSLEPTHPRPFVSKAATLFWRFALGNDDKLFDQLLAQIDRAIDVTESYQEKNSRDADPLTCLGTLYGYRAFAYARHKSYLKAAWDGKKSLDYFNDALELNPKAYDAYLGLGCYHYFASFAPKTLRWVISILGIDGDAALAVREVKLAQERGTFATIEAQYALAQFLPWQSGSFVASESLLVDLNKRFPGNSLIAFTLAVWEMRRNDVSPAKNLLQDVAQHDRGAVPGLKAMALSKIAECDFRLNDFQNAIDEYKTFLSIYHDENYQATAHFRIGISYELTGHRDEAIKHYQASISASHKQGDDSYSSRKAELYVKIPISSADSLLVIGNNLFKSGNYDDAIALFRQLDSLSGVSPSLQAEARYGIGETLFEQKLFAEALPYFNAVLTATIGDEQWLIPWAHYQLGLCHTSIGNKTVAKQEFTKALAFDNEYDFKNWLDFRTERELERLK